MTGTQKFEKEYLVHVYDTGPDGRAGLTSLFNYMQDIASEHAIILGFGRDDLIKNNHFWVLSRMYAVISALPSWNDRLTIKTWPCGTDKLFAMRGYEIRMSDGTLVASALSSWLIIDRSTKKIQRPGESLSRYNSNEQKNIEPVRRAMKLSDPPDAGKESPPFRVKVSDLDVNLHANNVNYLKWVNDTYDLNFIMNYRPCSAEINYLAESMFNDDIVIRTSSHEDDEKHFFHSVFRIQDNKELCRIRIEWTKE